MPELLNWIEDMLHATRMCRFAGLLLELSFGREAIEALIDWMDGV
jgi:hypothetical protein